MKAAHRNIKSCCKLPYYSRVLNNRTCKIIFLQPNFPYVRSLLATVRLLLLWTNFLSWTFILNCTINHFEHFFSNCFNKRKHIKFVIICEVVRFHTIWRKMTFTIQLWFWNQLVLATISIKIHSSTKVVLVFLLIGLVLLNELLHQIMWNVVLIRL